MTTTLDIGTLEDLYRLHGRVVLRYLRRYAHVDPHTAEDIVQETFLRAWRTPQVFAGSATSCRAWLVTVARNLLVDAMRRRARRPQEVGDTGLAALAVRSCAVESAATKLALHQAIAKLSLRQREIIGQIFLMHRTYPEAAVALDIPLGTAKSQAKAALRTLRRHLADVGFQPDDERAA